MFGFGEFAPLAPVDDRPRLALRSLRARARCGRGGSACRRPAARSPPTSAWPGLRWMSGTMRTCGKSACVTRFILRPSGKLAIRGVLHAVVGVIVGDVGHHAHLFDELHAAERRVQNRHVKGVHDVFPILQPVARHDLDRVVAAAAETRTGGVVASRRARCLRAYRSAAGAASFPAAPCRPRSCRSALRLDTTADE